MFKENTIMMKAKFIFDSKIPLKKIIEFLHEPKIVKKWETSINKIDLLTGKIYEDSVIIATRNYKGKDRKFVERWSTRTTLGMIISIAVDDKSQPELEENGETVFQLITIEEINAGTRVVLIQQLDPKLGSRDLDTQILESFKNSAIKLRDLISKWNYN